MIGSCIFKKLSRDHEVFGLDLKKSPYTSVVGDIRDFDLVKKVMKSVDAIIHCAAQTSVIRSVEDPLFDAQNNLIGTLNLLEAARGLKKLKRFIYFSSAAVYGIPKYLPIDEDHPTKPISPYGISKLAGEFYARLFHELYRVPTTCIRPFNVYGKLNSSSEYSGVISKFLERLKGKLPPVICDDGEQTRDFIHVRDVVDMIVLILERDEAVGETFNCGTGREISINKLADLAISISAMKLKPKYSDSRLGDIGRSYADIGKAERILGFRPKISIEQGLTELFNSMLKAS